MNLTVTINVNFPKPLEVNVRLLTDAAALSALTDQAESATQRLKDAIEANPAPTPPA